MTDLEKLTKVFDEIGIKYSLKGNKNKSELTILDNSALKLPGLTFKNDKFSHTFIKSNILLENNLSDQQVMLVLGEKGSYQSVCFCGYRKTTYHKPTICERCMTKNVKKIRSLSKDREALIDSTYELIEKSKLFFHLKKHDIYAVFDEEFEGFSLYTVPGYEIKMNFMERNFEVIKKTTSTINNKKDLEKFFGGVAATDAFVEMISTPDKKDYFDYMFNGAFKNKDSKPSVSNILLKFFESDYIDILLSAGINLKYIDVESFHKEETQLHKILGVPKAFLPHLKDFLKYRYLDMHDQEVINAATDKFGWNFVDEILTMVKNENIYYQLIGILDAVTELVDKYSYQTKHLIPYLAKHFEAKEYRDMLTMLRDYHKMCGDLKMAHDRYPKNLLQKHDEVSDEYKYFKNKNYRNFFKEAVNAKGYQSLAYESDDYSILVPKMMSEITREGSNLRHCVASYVSRVVDKECKILFLRKSSEKEKSLVTIEVRGNRIWQAKGSCNRETFKEEKEFLKKWAKENNLKLAL
jgi:hypothetical protein